VEHDHPLGLEAGDHGEPAPEAVDGPGQQLVGRQALEVGEVGFVQVGSEAVRPGGGGRRHSRAPLDTLGSGRSWPGRSESSRATLSHGTTAGPRDTRRTPPSRGPGRGCGSAAWRSWPATVRYKAPNRQQPEAKEPGPGPASSRASSPLGTPTSATTWARSASGWRCSATSRPSTWWAICTPSPWPTTTPTLRAR